MSVKHFILGVDPGFNNSGVVGFPLDENYDVCGVEFFDLITPPGENDFLKSVGFMHSFISLLLQLKASLVPYADFFVVSEAPLQDKRKSSLSTIALSHFVLAYSMLCGHDAMAVMSVKHFSFMKNYDLYYLDERVNKSIPKTKSKLGLTKKFSIGFVKEQNPKFYEEVLKKCGKNDHVFDAYVNALIGSYAVGFKKYPSFLESQPKLREIFLSKEKKGEKRSRLSVEKVYTGLLQRKDFLFVFDKVPSSIWYNHWDEIAKISESLNEL